MNPADKISPSTPFDHLRSDTPLTGWSCFRCGRIYGPNWHFCGPCNRKIEAREKEESESGKT